MMSSSTASKAPVRANRNAVGPSAAVTTSIPSARRPRSSALRTPGSSSTTKTRGCMYPLSPNRQTKARGPLSAVSAPQPDLSHRGGRWVAGREHWSTTQGEDMQPRTKGLVAALTGTALGVGGLVMLTVPAGADDAPVLPEISAQELVRTALQADPPAFAGKVVMQQNLGLPVPTGGDGSGAASFGLGFESARIFHDGDEGVRIAIQD